MNIYELIGLIIGDGSIMYNHISKGGKKHYRLMIDGDAKEDQEYFRNLSLFIKKISNKEPTTNIRKMFYKDGRFKGHKLELYINSKYFVSYLVEELNLAHGNKTYTVVIPSKFLEWRYSKHILRGIFESDGSLYFSKSRITLTYPSYPRLEIGTVSKRLAIQVYNILRDRKFKVQFMETKYNYYKIYISGPLMLRRWLKEIGFSNPSTISRYEVWKSLGYYIPKITYEERKKLLKSFK